MRHIIIAIFFSTILTGCFEGEKNLSLEKVGRTTYLLNQSSQKVYAVSKGSLIELKPNAITNKTGRILKQQTKISNNRLNISSSVKILDNKALYQLRIQPLLKNSKDKDGEPIETRDNYDWFKTIINKSDSYESITIVLTDKDDFTLAEHGVRVSRGYIKTVGNDDKVFAYSYEGEFNIDQNASKYSNYQDFVWNL